DLALLFFIVSRSPTRSALFPYTTLFRSDHSIRVVGHRVGRLSSQRHSPSARRLRLRGAPRRASRSPRVHVLQREVPRARGTTKRSEEHTSELQSRLELVCRLHLEKKK